MRYSIASVLLLMSGSALAVVAGQFVGVRVLTFMLAAIVAFAPSLFFVGTCLLKPLSIPQRILVFSLSLFLTGVSCFLTLDFGNRIPTLMIPVVAILWGLQILASVTVWFVWRNGHRSVQSVSQNSND